ncbi:CoA-transferase family III [Mollisia scopiformis]|uniref:CoA-transferase family III n=1 Tax=Mollisia scopiformis TaxID=149040 RepID=A0A132B4S9_MOLSC|nr:CoA-transferase family III [Mollisia scopiformis]KUJ06677.1 CoA-transferase family III [Mollisia scopiformis]
MTGKAPLTGLRVLELAGLAPGPFAGLLLADNGASVLRIDRAIPNVTHTDTPSRPPPPTNDLLTRHKSSVAIDLKSPSGIEFIKALVSHADVILDPFRPGVLEKLGIGPDILLGLNPKIIVGRMTGFRRDGRYKDMAGHDINYIAVSGALSMLGRKGENPLPPANILGDFAGGGATLFQGILLALFAREKTGRGQIVEANMVDGSAYLATFPRLLLNTPMWNKPRGENVLDGGCPWYDTYETKDGKHMAVGALEPQFFAELLKGLGLSGKGIERTRDDRRTWPELKHTFTKLFKAKTRSEWEVIFDGTDACCTPVLDYAELRQKDNGREGDQRPAVTLRNTPSLAVSNSDLPRDPATGQGPGIKGAGYVATILVPGRGGEETLNHWLGWKRGKDFDIENGGLIKKSSSKL